MLKTIVVGLFMVFIALTYQTISPPPPKKSYYADLFIASRIKLRDGRYLMYKEYGVSKEIAKYKAIFIHSLGASKYEAATITSEVLLEELGVHLVSFDRPGYGGSDPHPKRTMKSIALDIEELADQLDLGSKFHIIGYSMGGLLTWACLKYIPERLEKVAMLAPAINYWWPAFPSNLTKEAFRQQLPRDQWAINVARYAPWLVYWWNTQTWFPRLSVMDGESNWSQQDLKIISNFDMEQLQMAYVVQQGEYESFHRDMIIWSKNWEFDPMDSKNPFPNKEGFVHLWHGDEDCLVPVTLQRYIVGKLPWIKYHELQHFGHLFPFDNDLKNIIWKTFFSGEKSN